MRSDAADARIRSCDADSDTNGADGVRCGPAAAANPPDDGAGEATCGAGEATDPAGEARPAGRAVGAPGDPASPIGPAAIRGAINDSVLVSGAGGTDDSDMVSRG